jgi:hypothetical protein
MVFLLARKFTRFLCDRFHSSGGRSNAMQGELDIAANSRRLYLRAILLFVKVLNKMIL